MITIIKEPPYAYPAYNDSIIEFESSFPNDIMAEIYFDSTAITKPFVIYPNDSGVYIFNLKKIIEYVVNQQGFRDVNEFYNSFFKNIINTYFELPTRIKVMTSTQADENVVPIDSRFDVNTIVVDALHAGIWYITNPLGGNNYIEKKTDELETYFNIVLDSVDGANPAIQSYGDFSNNIKLLPLTLDFWVRAYSSDYIVVRMNNNYYTIGNLTSTWQHIQIEVMFSDNTPQRMEFKHYTQVSFDIKNLQLLLNSGLDQLSKVYFFFRGVKQLQKECFSNWRMLFSYSNDGVNYNLTYFEGFPFHFDIYRVNAQIPIAIRNDTTDETSTEMLPTETGSFRINIDNGGGNNWTADNFLELRENLNNLVVLDDATYPVTYIALTKKKICKGIYLKWFNNDGGYSFYLFNEFFVNTLESAEIGQIFNTDMENISDSIGKYNTIGKSAKEKIKAKVQYEAYDYELLKSLLVSPFVQMYTSREANVTGSFINVSVSGQFVYNSKKYVNELTINIVMDEIQTAKL